MRNFVIPLLLASVAVTPAAAQSTREERQAAREEARQSVRDNVRQSARERASSAREDRQNAREERQNAAAVEPTAVVAPAPPKATVNARDRAQIVRDRVETSRDNREAQVAERNRLAGQGSVRQAADQKAKIEAIRKRMKDSRDAMVSSIPKYGTQPPAPVTSRPDPAPTWHRDNWRHDHRYDWSDYRYRNGWMFNLGYYNDPYGFGYYPYGYGSRMWPSYYQANYWINDPWMYRLPYPPPGTRWVRYYNDVVLVDMWSGQVLDVIRDFFW